MKGFPLQPVGKGLGAVFQRCVETTLEKCGEFFLQFTPCQETGTKTQHDEFSANLFCLCHHPLGFHQGKGIAGHISDGFTSLKKTDAGNREA